MAKQCMECGQSNEDSALRCACGSDLPAEAAPLPPAPTAPEPASRAPSPPKERSFRLRQIVFVVGAIGFIPLFAMLRSLLNVSPILRSLIGTGIFCVPAIAALWFLGRDKQRTLHVWRIVFVVWALLLLPLLLTIAQGLAAEGWPRGRFNRQIQELLILVLIFTVPAFLTGLGALIRTYRLTGGLALVTGLGYLVNAVLLLRATAPAKGLRLRFEDVLDIVLLGAQMGSYLSIPMGVALIVGGIMVFRGGVTRASQP